MKLTSKFTVQQPACTMKVQTAALGIGLGRARKLMHVPALDNRVGASYTAKTSKRIIPGFKICPIVHSSGQIGITGVYMQRAGTQVETNGTRSKSGTLRTANDRTSLVVIVVEHLDEKHRQGELERQLNGREGQRCTCDRRGCSKQHGGCIEQLCSCDKRLSGGDQQLCMCSGQHGICNDSNFIGGGARRRRGASTKHVHRIPQFRQEGARSSSCGMPNSTGTPAQRLKAVKKRLREQTLVSSDGVGQRVMNRCVRKDVLGLNSGLDHPARASKRSDRSRSARSERLESTASDPDGVFPL
mmetsp:Transcript_3164/g.9025  ORF Transcript_3164/g.9025 Transcript_3164/m.9025 type:complete len:300 (+) Transcript_3164:43-942(+)